MNRAKARLADLDEKIATQANDEDGVTHPLTNIAIVLRLPAETSAPGVELIVVTMSRV